MTTRVNLYFPRDENGPVDYQEGYWLNWIQQHIPDQINEFWDACDATAVTFYQALIGTVDYIVEDGVIVGRTYLIDGDDVPADPFYKEVELSIVNDPSWVTPGRFEIINE